MILLILVLAIIFLCAFNGFRKGLFGIVFGLISWAVIILSVIFLSPVMQNYLENRTEVGKKIYESAKGYIEQKLTHTGSGTLDSMVAKDEKKDTDSMSFIADIISRLVSDVDKNKNPATEDISDSSGSASYDSTLPPAMNRSIRGTAQEAIEDYNINSAVSEAKGTVVSFVAESVASKIRDYALSGLSKILTFLIAAIACFIVRIIFKVIMMDKGFAIRQHILGVLFGLLEGFLLVWILMYLISCIGTTAFGRSLAETIDGSVILSWFYNNNPLVGGS